MSRQQAVQALYNHDYAAGFEKLYLHKLPEKHILNILNLKRIISQWPQRAIRWLDLACGQAWHFSQFPGPHWKVGVDLSPYQLRRARLRNPKDRFLCADIAEISFPPASFDLVTNFWAGYCYLDSQPLIRRLMSKACRWVRPGGALYLEVLPPEDVAKFNRSQYALGTGFRVAGRTPDYRKWAYFDPGGRHNMTSPPLAMFSELLSRRFEDVEAEHDSGFLVHAIGWKRRQKSP